LGKADLPQRTSPGSIFGHVEEKAANHEEVRPSPFSLAASAPKKPQPPIRCPECGSTSLYRDGLRYLKDGSSVQRWLCKACFYRFTDPEHKALINKYLKNNNAENEAMKGVQIPQAHGSAKAVYALTEKPLATTATTERETAETQQSLIFKYAWEMKKRGQAEKTIKGRVWRLTCLAKKGADLMNPDSVETVLATENWTPANKKFFVMAYLSFTRAFGIPWKPIKIHVEPKQPFIPLEREIDSLIDGCGKVVGAFLQVLKDTGARSGEALKLRWTDVNVESNTIAINNPEKGSHSRTVKVSPKCIAMLNALPKKGEYIFSNYRSLQSTFSRSRKRIAAKLGNPRLLSIHFHTLRHWKGTVEYAKTKNILWVKYLLGHKRLENTEVYTHLIDFENEEYHSATAKTIEEAKQLIEAGFEYVCDMEGVKLFRKRK